MHEIVIIIAKYFIVIPVLIAAWVWFHQSRPRQKSFFIVAVLSAVVALLVAKLMSHLYYDPRPFVSGHVVPYFSHGADNGFPSDHTLLASLLAGITLLYDRRLGLVSLGVALLIGLARVIAGVHHLIDVLGAVVISLMAVTIVAAIYRLWFKPSEPPADHAD